MYRNKTLSAGSVATALGLIAGMVVISRLLFLSSSVGMAYDSPSYVYLVREFVTRWSHGAWLTTIEMGHPFYVVWDGLVVHAVRSIWPVATLVFCIKVAGILAAALSVVPLYWIGVWSLKSRRLGLVAAWLFAAIPLMWWWSGEVMSDATSATSVVWAFGLLARWRTTGRSGWLGLACIAFGAAPLFRVSAAAFAPLFAWWWLGGRPQRPARTALWSFALLALPTVALLGFEWLAYDRPFGAALARNPVHSALDWTRLWSLSAWRGYGRHALHSLGWVAAGATAAGFLIAVVRRRSLAVTASLWLAGTLTLPLVVPAIGPQIRMLLPLMPMCALLMALVVGTIGRALDRRFRWSGAIVAAALGLAMTAQAFPDLVALHTKVSVHEAVARWCRQHAEPNALVIAGGDRFHVEFLSYHRAMHFRVGWGGGPHVRDAVHGPTLMWKVDAALRRKEPVYVSGLVRPRQLAMLDRCYRLEPVVQFAGAGLRNLYDPGFVTLGEQMRMTGDVTIYSVHFGENKWKPRAAPPVVAFRCAPGKVEIRVSCLRAANLRAYPVLAQSPRALDWLLEKPRPDELLRTFGTLAQQYEKRLDSRGRTTFVVDVSPGLRRIFAACLIIDDVGAPELASVAAEVADAPP